MEVKTFVMLYKKLQTVCEETVKNSEKQQRKNMIKIGQS